MQITFLEGPQILAVSVESSGRMLSHNITLYLSLTAKLTGRLTKSVQPVLLTNGQQLGPVCQLLNLSAARAGSALKADPGTQQEESHHALEGLILVCSARGASVGKLSIQYLLKAT